MFQEAEIIAGNGEIVFAGSYSPGDSPALVDFAWDATFASTTSLLLELGGTVRGTEYDALDLVGSATLRGELQVVFIDDYDPNLGVAFTLITANQLMGSFATELLPSLEAGLEWLLDYDTVASEFRLEVVSSGLPGDFDEDGRVDGLDFLAWQSDTSIGDLADWEVNYGAGGSLQQALNSVPEPSSLILLGLCGLLTLNATRQA